MSRSTPVIRPPRAAPRGGLFSRQGVFHFSFGVRHSEENKSHVAAQDDLPERTAP